MNVEKVPSHTGHLYTDTRCTHVHMLQHKTDQSVVGIEGAHTFLLQIVRVTLKTRWVELPVHGSVSAIVSTYMYMYYSD